MPAWTLCLDAVFICRQGDSGDLWGRSLVKVKYALNKPNCTEAVARSTLGADVHFLWRLQRVRVKVMSSDGCRETCFPQGGTVSGSCHICEQRQKAFNMSGAISYDRPSWK